MPAGSEHKAFALNFNGNTGFSYKQPSEEVARNAAIEQCQKRADNVGSPNKCEVYAVSDNVVYPHARPPMPPLPWFKPDQVVERPFSPNDMPLTRDAAKARLATGFGASRRPKALALGPTQYFASWGQGIEEATRRALEACGAINGAACMIVAIDDNFVVPIPSTMKATGFFKAADSSLIAPEARADAARRFSDAASGWSAVAVGAARRPGLGLKEASEQAAVNAAMSECAKRDSDCRVIAIGPFAVGPN
jgi:adenylate cyclase